MVIRNVRIWALKQETFAPFGTFDDLTSLPSVAFGASPVLFSPDRLRLDMNGKSTLGISICQVTARPIIVDTTEYHETCEGILPLDGNVVIHVAQPSANGDVPWDRIQAFVVPMGTCVVLHKGVWHHAPFACNGTVNVLILLPDRTYAQDCTVVDLTSLEGHDRRTQLEI